MTSISLRILAQTLPFLLIAPAIALAQTPPSRTEAKAALHASANPSPSATHFTKQQLDQMLAPIALYPDELLSQVLMAATYPQQVLDAAQWLRDPSHKDAKGDALAQALEPLPWDPSVKSLVAFPQIIAMMAEHIEWTQALGTAFAEDQVAVMVRIQALRHLAMQSGKLKSVKHLTVREEGGEIVIISAEPDRIYVPIYNPLVVYGGDWPDRDYPPVYLPPPQGFVAETIEPGIEISSGFAAVGSLWGWSHPDWREHRITVERDRYTRITRNAQISSDNVWHRTGSIERVQNAPSTTTTTTQVPAGTVAPSSVGRSGQAAQGRSGTPNTTASTPGTAQPATQANKPSSTTSAQPQTTQPGQNASGASGSDRRQATNPSERRQTTTAPGQASGTTTQPASKSGTGAVQPTTPSSPANTARHEQGEGAGRGPEHRQVPGENEMRREPTAPGSGSSQERQERAREQEQNRPNAAQTPSPPPAAPPNPQAQSHMPPQGAAPAPQQAERPRPPTQGSSTPPAAAPQPPKPGGAPHEQKRGEDEQKNGR